MPDITVLRISILSIRLVARDVPIIPYGLSSYGSLSEGEVTLLIKATA
jgi:hypothetical protein